MVHIEHSQHLQHLQHLGAGSMMNCNLTLISCGCHAASKEGIPHALPFARRQADYLGLYHGPCTWLGRDPPPKQDHGSVNLALCPASVRPSLCADGSGCHGCHGRVARLLRSLLLPTVSACRCFARCLSLVVLPFYLKTGPRPHSRHCVTHQTHWPITTSFRSTLLLPRSPVAAARYVLRKPVLFGQILAASPIDACYVAFQPAGLPPRRQLPDLTGT